MRFFEINREKKLIRNFDFINDAHIQCNILDSKNVSEIYYYLLVHAQASYHHYKKSCRLTYISHKVIGIQMVQNYGVLISSHIIIKKKKLIEFSI